MENKEDKGNKLYQELKCIWMSSNVIDYKLCDQNFDCENCSFDKVMRNLSSEKPVEKETPNEEKRDLFETVIEKIRSETYEQKIIYLRNQLMLKPIFSNTYYLGINPFMFHLLDNISNVTNGNTNKYIMKDQPLISIEGNWGSVSFTAPINILMIDKINFSPDELKSGKWFGIVGINPTDLTTARILPGEWHSNQVKVLNLLSNLKGSYSSVGETMMDGGREVRYFYQLLGEEKFLQLIQQLF